MPLDSVSHASHFLKRHDVSVCWHSNVPRPSWHLPTSLTTAPGNVPTWQGPEGRRTHGKGSAASRHRVLCVLIPRDLGTVTPGLSWLSNWASVSRLQASVSVSKMGHAARRGLGEGVGDARCRSPRLRRLGVRQWLSESTPDTPQSTVPATAGADQEGRNRHCSPGTAELPTGVSEVALSADRAWNVMGGVARPETWSGVSVCPVPGSPPALLFSGTADWRRGAAAPGLGPRSCASLCSGQALPGPGQLRLNSPPTRWPPLVLFLPDASLPHGPSLALVPWAFFSPVPLLPCPHLSPSVP